MRASRIRELTGDAEEAAVWDAAGVNERDQRTSPPGERGEPGMGAGGADGPLCEMEQRSSMAGAAGSSRRLTPEEDRASITCRRVPPSRDAFDESAGCRPCTKSPSSDTVSPSPPQCTMTSIPAQSRTGSLGAEAFVFTNSFEVRLREPRTYNHYTGMSLTVEQCSLVSPNCESRQVSSAAA